HPSRGSACWSTGSPAPTPIFAGSCERICPRTGSSVWMPPGSHRQSRSSLERSALLGVLKTMDIAVFADVHGRVELCFKLCARWQQETDRTLDAILQAGDLGAFFARAHLDKATLRYAQDDPSELGFLEHFTAYHTHTAAVLSATTCPMFFVRG